MGDDGFRKKHSIFWAAVVMLVAGCGGGYRLQLTDGGETLYRCDGKGSPVVVYRVGANGSVTLYDEDDPAARRYLAGRTAGKRIDGYLESLRAGGAAGGRGDEAERRRRIERIKAAAKRTEYDPIFVMIHEPAFDPQMDRTVDDPHRSKERMAQWLARTISADDTLQVTPQLADVDIFSQSYFKVSKTFNIQTHRMSETNVFHFRVDIHSRYLPEDRYSIEETGHWFESERIIQRAARRVGKIIKTMIGPNIPAERYKYL
jgi:hypothetical protein